MGVGVGVAYGTSLMPWTRASPFAAATRWCSPWASFAFTETVAGLAWPPVFGTFRVNGAPLSTVSRIVVPATGLVTSSMSVYVAAWGTSSV